VGLPAAYCSISSNHSSSWADDAALLVGNDPMTPALQAAPTSAGVEIKVMGAATAGIGSSASNSRKRSVLDRVALSGMDVAPDCTERLRAGEVRIAACHEGRHALDHVLGGVGDVLAQRLLLDRFLEARGGAAVEQSLDHAQRRR